MEGGGGLTVVTAFGWAACHSGRRAGIVRLLMAFNSLIKYIYKLLVGSLVGAIYDGF